MWVISGDIYNLQAGLERAAELEQKLAKVLGEELEQTVQAVKEEEYKRELICWEKEKQEHLETMQRKQAGNKLFRNCLGTALILGVPVFIYALYFTAKAEYVETPPSLMEDLLFLGFWLVLEAAKCFLPLFFFGGSLTYLVMLLNRNPEKNIATRLPKKPTPNHSELNASNWFGVKKSFKNRVRGFQKHYINNGYANNFGAEGEARLVKELNASVPEDYVCITGAMVGGGLDADIILIGSSAIWVLESKYINGRIEKRDAGWYRNKPYFEPGGFQEFQEDHLGDIEDQWLREKQSVETTLEKRCPSSLATIEGFVRGGIVFTHRDSVIYKPENVRVDVGDIRYWKNKILNGRYERNLSDRERLLIADAVLDYSRMINSSQTNSAAALAEEIYEDKKEAAMTYIDKNKQKIAQARAENSAAIYR